MRPSWKQIAAIALTGAALLGYQNCSQAGFGRDQTSYNSLAQDYGGSPICDPLAGGTGTASGRRGLIGNLVYVPALKDPKTTVTSMGTFLANAVQADGTVFMSQINVPTVAWDQGFKISDGSLLKDPSTGKPLLEYFGLNVQSVLTVNGPEEEGFYQFATVSDDGALLTSGTQVLAGAIDDAHSTRVDCGGTAVQITRAKSLAINYFYYQAPADRIASVLLWRRLPTAVIPDQINCGSNQPYEFFSSSNPNGLAKMLAAGWQIIPAANYVLPGDAPSNTCR